MKKLESESTTFETDVFSPLAISGKAGRYMSMENGPIAVSRPSIRMIYDLLFLI
jgi:hypothetical protein